MRKAESPELLANLERPTHTLNTPQNLPQPPSLHAGPSPTWSSQTITFKGNHLACALSFFGLRYVVAAAVASTLPPTILPPDREKNLPSRTVSALTPVVCGDSRSYWQRTAVLSLPDSCVVLFPFFLRRLPKSIVPVGRVSAPRQPPVIFVGKGHFGETNGTLLPNAPCGLTFFFFYFPFLFSLLFFYLFLVVPPFLLLTALKAWNWELASLP